MPRQAIKQRTDGRYRVKYNGRQFYGDTQSEALSKRDAYKRDIAAGLREDALGITFESYASKWLVAYKQECQPQTYNTFVRHLNSVIAANPAKRMCDFTASDIRLLYNTQAGKSMAQIKKYSGTIRAIFAAAVEDGIILRNPCVNVRLPDGPVGTHRAITPQERELVHAMIGNHDFALASMLMLYAGLRRGELLAFDIDRDVDFKAGLVHVREAVHFDSNQPIVGGTKTRAGVRSIPLFEPLRKALSGQHGLIVARQSGEIMSEIGVRRKFDSYITTMEAMLNGCHKRWYGKTKEHKSILDRGEDLPPWQSITIRMHDFRHSFCSMLYDADVDIKTAQKWMGHADEKMILRIYAHLSEEKEAEAAKSVSRKINKMLKGSNSGSNSKR